MGAATQLEGAGLALSTPDRDSEAALLSFVLQEINARFWKEGYEDLRQLRPQLAGLPGA